MDLLEREHELAALTDALSDAARGSGSLIAISGEAGIGKTELIRAFVHSLNGQATTLWGGCDDLSTPRTLGPFRDIAIQVGGPLRDLLASGGTRGDVLDAILEVLDRARPATVAVVEDVHWADGATLDVLKFLGRRIDRMATVLVITYRSEEVGPDHPLRLVVGEIPAPSIRRIPLSPLSRGAVATLAPDYSGSFEELFEATGGNPFLVSEALATPGVSASAGVRDAVLARAARLSPAARDLAELISVVPTQIERSMLKSVAEDSTESLEDCRRRGLVDYDETWAWYRHELVRTAVEDSLPPERRRRLNGVVLEQLVSSGGDVARVVHHGAEAGDSAALARFAPIAARQASAAAAHKEALNHFRVAAEHTSGLSTTEQASLLSDYAVESYLGDEVGAALDLSERALDLWRQLRDAELQGEMLRWQSRFHWWLGRADDAERTGLAAVEVLEGVPASDHLPMAYSNLAQLAMLAQEYEPAVEWSTKAIESARNRDDQSTLAHALNNLGSARIRVGDLSGFDLLRESLDISRRHRFDDHAGRAFSNLIWTALDYRMYDDADEYLTEGVAYATKRDLSGSLHYMVAERATLRLERGDWAGAEADLRWVLDQPEQPGITQMPALATLARLAVRRGDADAEQMVQAALTLAEPTGELQRIAPVAAARAELAWLGGDHAAIRTAVAESYARAAALAQPWITDELAFWLWRSGTGEVDPQPAETPYALQMAGHWREAAAAWDEVGCPYQRATAMYDSNDVSDLLAALEILDGLEAAPAGRLVRHRLRSLGVRKIPRGPRRATRSHPAGLTPRQVEVLRLIVDGRTNSEIADELFVSPKTVDHHVSAILSKLEVSSRQDAARIAVERKLLEE